MIRPTLYLMIGIQGSGKSTTAGEIAYLRNGVVVSRDKIRLSMIKDGDRYFSKEKDVFREFLKQIQDNLMAGKDVVADATHINRASRRKVLNAVRNLCGKIIAVQMDVPVQVCIARDAKREGRAHVGEAVIMDYIKGYEKAGYDEGFDDIIHVNLDGEFQ